MRISSYFIFLFLLIGFSCTRAESVTPIAWQNAHWIGYSKDNRSVDWSTRSVCFNWPSANIHTWVPTPDDLKTRNRKSFPSPQLRKSFTVNKPIASANIAVCGLGLYELYLNGKKVGDRVLDPAQTSYEMRAFYVVHDVAKLLKQNKNAVGLILGNGFFGQSVAMQANHSYGKPRAIAVLNISYVDGTSEIIVTDESWKAINSPILFDNIFLGETFDARMLFDDWSTPEFVDSAWMPVELMKSPTNKLLEQHMEPMRKIRKIEPIAVYKAEKGWILDMGQNMTGWLQINVTEKEGTAIKMRFAEHLMPNKENIDPASTGIHFTGDTQTDIYICSGKGVETWEPRFTYHGFRYVQIEGLTQKPELQDFTGWLVRTDVARIGTFECSDTLINKFYNVSMWTIEDNIQGILTDCPHRERCAWMGDNYAVAEAASYNFNLEKFWRKMAADVETTLGKMAASVGDSLPQDSRAPCNIAVGKRLGRQAKPDWGAATVMVPWFSYVHYGDISIVKQAWTLMTGWMAYLDDFAVKDGIIRQGYGDWCPPGSNIVMDTSPSLTSTALYYQSLKAMEKMALLMNDVESSLAYAKKAVIVKDAFNQKFLNSETNSYGSQTGNAFALYSGLVPAGKEQGVADRLADFVMKDSQGHYSTGIFGHRSLYTALNDYGHADVTRHLWRITDFPSLGFLTEEHDLTTWPETPFNWPKGERYRRNSFNHPMHSGFAATFHESLGGIRPDEEHPGFKNFFLKPTFIPDLEWVKVSYQSSYGEIVSSWKRQNGNIRWSITVPENTTAQVQLSAYVIKQIKLNERQVKENTFTLSPGSYLISVKEESGISTK